MELVFVGKIRFLRYMTSNLEAWRRTRPVKNIITYAKGREGANNAVAANTLTMFI